MDLSSLRGMLQGVFQDIGQHLGHAVGVDVEAGETRINVQLHLYLLLTSGVEVRCMQIFKQFPGSHFLQGDAQLTRIRQGERAQVIHQMLQPLRLFKDDLEVLLVGRQHAVVDRVRMAQDQAQGRAQFVGDVGGHLLARFGGVRQVGAHLVEGSRQFSQFISRVHGDL